MYFPFEHNLANKRVYVTGHTGFTGGWLCLWLKKIGAEVKGYALAPETTPSLYQLLGLDRELGTDFGDIRDAELLAKDVADFKPHLLIHLAAQPLVRRSYRNPAETFAVNVQGTINVLEAARKSGSVRGLLCVTSDKVYQNREWVWPYRENDPLGGKDPYSASKAAAEIAVASYAASFAWKDGLGPAIATARGGNIVGGGDWSEDRLIPDFVRAVTSEKTLTLRYPDATRPWQHVLALVHGYLLILGHLAGDNPEAAAGAWNLGPQDPRAWSVRQIIDSMCEHWTFPSINYLHEPLHEAQMLAVDSTRARNELGWQPLWDVKTTVRETASWYRAWHANPAEAKTVTEEQLERWRGAYS